MIPILRENYALVNEFVAFYCREECFRFGNGELEKKCLRVLHTFTRKVISERQKELVERNWCFEGRLAFLDLLLEMVHQGQLNPDEVQQQVDTFMFAGHDTTSTSSAWVLFVLGCYPEIQRRVQAEVDEVLGDHDCILPEHLPRLKYLECCLKESLRLYPSVPMIMRELGESEELGGVSLPKGTQVVINQYMIHRDPTNWPDPEKFDPDRFAHDSDVRRNPFAFIPFSAGSRNCIGQRFALMVEKVVVSWILRHFNIASIQTRCGMKTRTSLVLRPSNGIHVFLERRRAVTGEYKD
ncbi:hypothetical protein Q1695_004809 [Nippostrongylus brasiliensis]|nr:hypothetical protein Q1695_004809 [Nippostrongylus brasiliensis]